MASWKYIKDAEFDEAFRDKNSNFWKYKKSNLKDVELAKVIGIVDVNQKKRRIGSLYADGNTIKISANQKLNFLTKVLGIIQVERVRDDLNQDSGTVLVVKSRIPLIMKLITLVLLVLGLWGFWYLTTRDTAIKYDENAIAYKMPDNTKIQADENQIAIPGYNTILMDSKANEMYIALANPEGNPCDFEYTIMLKDSNEVLYKSNRIRPGTAVTRQPLERQISKGTYSIIIKIDAFDLENPESRLNGGEVETSLIVK